MTEIGRLVEVGARSLWAHEARHFTPWLLANAEALGDALGIAISLEAAEHPVGGFALDLLGVDHTNDAPLTVENQLEITDHDHLGKVITYAAGVDARTVVWIALAFRQEHRTALGWLNANTQESIRFFGVELRAVRIGESAPAPLFKVVVEPSDWQKRVRTLAEASVLSGKQALYAQFWRLFLERARAERPGMPWRANAPRDSWMELRSPVRGTIITFAFSTGRGVRIELYIDCGDGAANKRLFERLLEHREMLEREMGSTLNWDPLSGRRASRISIFMPGGGDVTEEDRYNEFLAWFLATGERWFRAWTRVAEQLQATRQSSQAMSADAASQLPAEL